MFLAKAGPKEHGISSCHKRNMIYLCFETTWSGGTTMHYHRALTLSLFTGIYDDYVFSTNLARSKVGIWLSLQARFCDIRCPHTFPNLVTGYLFRIRNKKSAAKQKFLPYLIQKRKINTKYEVGRIKMSMCTVGLIL